MTSCTGTGRRRPGPRHSTLDAAAQAMVSTFGGILDAAAEISRLQIGPTAGHDSRLIAAVDAGLSTLVPVMGPQNCRRLQMEGFATTALLRGRPNRLFRRIFEIVAPDLLEIPFNFGRAEI